MNVLTHQYAPLAIDVLTRLVAIIVFQNVIKAIDSMLEQENVKV